MKSLFTHFGAISIFTSAVFVLHTRNEVKAVETVGVLYNDPGWFYSYEGNEAFYNDLDGPNPDYINGDDQNSPGGSGGTPALVDPRVLDPGCNPTMAGNCLGAEWLFKSSQWDGSAPGDPLGGVPTGTPPLLPAAAPRFQIGRASCRERV